MQPSDATPEEAKAIRALRRLGRQWPKSLWLFAGAGQGLHVMRKTPDGNHAHTRLGGVDPEYVLATVNIDSDGGDW